MTEDPTGPLFGLRPLTFGDVTVKGTALLVTPPTITVTFPLTAPAGTGTMIVVWLQLVGVVAPVPGNATALDACVGPKLLPVMVTEVPTGPEVGFKAVMVTGVTVKLKLLLAKPPAVTTSGPVVAPDGTSTAAPVSIQLCIVAGVPLNVTVSPGTRFPKFVPGIDMESPTAPKGGLTFVIVGVTVNGTKLLATPLTSMYAFPLVAPTGTGTVMLVALQFVGVAGVRLKVTVLVPCVAPKFVPVMVTEVPTRAALGLMFVMLGGGRTVNATPLLARPLTLTTTFPVVAPVGTGTTMLVLLQLVGVADVPLNVIVLVPGDAPKLLPAMVAEIPTGAEVGERLVILGGIVNSAPLLARPETVTTTLPAVAPVGTDTTMLVSLQLVGVANVPLNVTVLVP